MDIEFAWCRDAKGYRLAQEAPIEHISSLWPPPDVRYPEGFPDLSSNPDERSLFIVGKGGSQIPYPADQTLDRAFNEFINTQSSPEGALGFANRWGLLTGGADGQAEPVKYAVHTIMAMNQILEAWSEPEEAPRTPLLEALMGADGFGLGRINAHLVFDQVTRAPKTRLMVENLLTALWLQLAKTLSTRDAIMRRCAHCQEWFAAGLGTDRRLDARFCSDQHRFLFHRHKAAPTPEEPSRRRGRDRAGV